MIHNMVFLLFIILFFWLIRAPCNFAKKTLGDVGDSLKIAKSFFFPRFSHPTLPVDLSFSFGLSIVFSDYYCEK